MSDPTIRFDGKTIAITGAGRGLGRTYALELARRGANVVVNDLASNAEYSDDGASLGPADRVAAEIIDAGGSAVVSSASVADPEGGQAIIDSAIDTFGRIDGIVHNAATRHNAPFEEMSVEMIESVVRVSLSGGFWLARAAWPLFKAQGYGRVVLTSSNVGAFGLPGLANYAAAKAGLIGLGQVLALEGEEFGIRVNTVLPVADTASGSARPVGRRHLPGIVERLRDVQPTGERGRPELVAALVVYLLSRACALTGHAISAAGGRYARVCIAATHGWLSEEATVSVEDIAAHLAEIVDLSRWDVPRSAVEELASISERIEELG